MDYFHKRKYCLVLLILVVAFIVRIIYLLGDAPAADISRSGVFYVDEGTYSHNAVNKVLFNKWFLEDDYNAMSNVPVFTLCQYVFLEIFGVGLKSIKIPGIIYTIISLFLLWILLSKNDFASALVVIIFSSLNYFFMIYNRLALLENLLILLLVLTTIFLFLYYQKNHVLWLIAAVFTFWMGFFVKPIVLFFLPMLIITILLRPVAKREKINHLLIYSSVTSIILILIYIFWIAHRSVDWNYFQSRNIHHLINESFLIFLINYARYFSNLKLFQFMPITYSIFLLYITFLIYELSLKKKLPIQDWFFLGWAICGFIFLGFFKYSPPRHSLVLIPAILVLTASFLLKVYRNQITFSDKNVFILLTPVTILALSQIGFGIYRILVYEQNYLSCYLPLISLLLIPLFFLLMQDKINKKIITSFLFTSIILLNSFQIYQYYSHIQFSYYNAIQDMKKIIKHQDSDNNILLGDIAPLVSVELKTKAVNIIFRGESEDRRILKNRPNLLVLQDNEELQRLYHKLPYYFQNIELLNSYEIFNNYLNHDNTYFYQIENDFEKEKLWVKK